MKVFITPYLSCEKVMKVLMGSHESLHYAWFNAQVGRSGAGNNVFKKKQNKYIAILSVFSDGEF